VDQSTDVAGTLDIVGFKVSALDFDGNAALISEAALSGRGLWVLTLNVEMMARAATDPAYRKLLEDVDFTIADGMPIVLLSRLGLTPGHIPQRTCGVDLVKHCLEAFPGRIGIVGGVNPRAALERLGIAPSRVPFIFDGKIDPANLDQILAQVKDARCQLVFVALGVPKQDLVCRALRKACPEVVCAGIGGSFEILGGLVPRAPGFMRAIGFEWLYRLLCEPRRLARRYLLLYPRVIPAVIAWMRASSRSA